ncbi:Rossmann-like and DUF2520 domain-containing protein [Peptostreptococcus canis]|uniref:DUF2520 domain-containing protein n=1 Tax=Peptostreptococcus canis TaxID=1159213 RepID=A0ABR6TMK9_9FIRM|nr:Rossmann-like and DUF2520 domain-containing protein [Peptostreptococcus canis]MBC2576660.1 DUF2520 domain-containing protein [Peptostreptococcus canis]MBP1998590.1 putative short-subunit dehydrogenase-like oxidoreductase (DUF2520 family) [Peptostreptococcus canis]
MYKVGIIGAGKVGISVGLYFFNTDEFEISGYYSKSLDSIKYASKMTNSAQFNNLEKLVNKSDILIITTPDDSISEVWEKVSHFNIQNKIICHCSGSLSSEIFFDISSKGAHGCSLHPLMAISSKENSYKDMNNTFFTLEGDKKAIEVIEKLLISKNNQYKIIHTMDKIKYHLASVFLSNLVLSLGNISLGLLEEYGFDEKDALNAFSSLAIGNLKNFFEKGVVDSITGPVERNDIGTIENHLKSISSDNYIDVDKIYRLLSLEIIKVAEKKHKDRDYKNLKGLLRKERL